MRTLSLLLFAALPACSLFGGAEFGPWREGLHEANISKWQSTEFGGEGEVHLAPAEMTFGMGNPLTGVTWTGAPPSGNYQLEVIAARVEGLDFFCGLTFPVRDSHLTLVLGGWGGSISGLSNLDGLDAASNETRTLRGFQADRDYRIVIDVSDARVTVTIDDEPFLAADIADKQLSLRPEVELSKPLGIASFAADARITRLRWRSTEGR